MTEGNEESKMRPFAAFRVIISDAMSGQLRLKGKKAIVRVWSPGDG